MTVEWSYVPNPTPQYPITAYESWYSDNLEPFYIGVYRYGSGRVAWSVDTNEERFAEDDDAKCTVYEAKARAIVALKQVLTDTLAKLEET